MLLFLLIAFFYLIYSIFLVFLNWWDEFLLTEGGCKNIVLFIDSAVPDF